MTSRQTVRSVDLVAVVRAHRARLLVARVDRLLNLAVEVPMALEVRVVRVAPDQTRV